MRAAVLEEINHDLVLLRLVIPELKYGQVLVRVHASGVCGKQVGEMTGLWGPDRHLPHLLGHEGAGIVEEIGEGITHVKIGDHVVLHWRVGQGINSEPPKYTDMSGRTIGGGWVTTFNNYAVVSENRLTVINSDVPFGIAALMGCAITTGYGAIFNEMNLKPWHSITMCGCGGIGLTIIQAAKLAGAYPIIGIDKNKYKLNLAMEFGADEAHLITEKQYNTDFVVTSYNGLYIEDRNNGKIFESRGGLTEPNRDIPIYLRMWEQGRIDIRKLITNTFELDDINDALHLSQSGMSGRCVIRMD